MTFKRITTLSLTLAFSCVDLALPQTETHWTHLRMEGVAAYGVGDYAAAAKALLACKQEAERAGAKVEELADIWTELAATYSAMGRYAEAEALDRRALKSRE